jgi:hypothetical protein
MWQRPNHGHRYDPYDHSERRRERPSPFTPFEAFLSDPFFASPMGNSSRSRHHPFHHHFTDPFTLFEETLGSDFSADFTPRTRHTRRPFRSHRNRDHEGDAFGMSLFPRPFGFNFPMLSGFGMNDEGPSRYTSTHMFSSEMRVGRDGRWVSERKSSKNVNGVIESRWEGVDQDVSLSYCVIDVP